MERNDFRLDSILKNHIGEEIYSRAYGEVNIFKINQNPLGFNIDIKVETLESTFMLKSYLYNGKLFNNGTIDLYPSKEYFHKYPFNAEEAWLEWREKHEKWRGIIGKEYYYLNSCMRIVAAIEKNSSCDDERYTLGNYFRRIKQAEDAAERIKSILDCFHNEK